MPDTEAGRALLAASSFHAWDCFGGTPCACGLGEHIDDIEREAAARALAEVRERVERLPRYEALSPLVYREFEPGDGRGSALDRVAVLAAIEEASRG